MFFFLCGLCELCGKTFFDLRCAIGLERIGVRGSFPFRTPELDLGGGLIASW
jgi:hypothetical protein